MPAEARTRHGQERNMEQARTDLSAMILIPGGTFWMGSDAHYPEEGSARLVSVDSFRIDEAPVTNREFARFIAATGYVTQAEIAPDPALYPGADPALLKPGSSLFSRPERPVGLGDPFAWWRFAIGVDWRHPWSPESGTEGLLDISLMPTPKPMHDGPESACLPKRNGNMPRAAGWIVAPSPGATILRRMACYSQITGGARSPPRGWRRMGTNGHRPSAPIRPMVTGSMI